jgi:recombination protein RecA
MGNRVRARVVKNKVAAPFRVAEFDIMFNLGISKMGDILEIGVEQGIIKKSGAFYSYGETKLGQGRENSKEFLTQHPEIAASVEARLRTPADEATEAPAPANEAAPNGDSVADILSGAATLETDEEDDDE